MRRGSITRAAAVFGATALLAGFSDLPDADSLPVQALETEVDATATLPADEPDFEIVSEGRASYYGKRFAGRPTANGEIFDPGELTAAHRTLPFGTLVRVTHARTGESVDVRINDRGPFHGNRVIDLSRAAAEEIGMVREGVAPVTVALIDAE